MDRTNLHATALVAGGNGVLILGPAGSGKSALALHLVARCRAAGVFAALVADDQVLASARAGRLLVEVPASIAGLVEVRGYGPVAAAHEPRTVVDLVVRLEPDAPRHRDDLAETVAGIPLPLLVLPPRNAAAAGNAVLAALGLAF